MSEISKLFVDKFRPKKLAEMILDEKIRSLIQSYLDKKTCPNLILAGRPGLGKTVLANAIVNELGAPHLYVHCGSKAIGVDYIQSKVADFCQSVSMEPGVPKIVILDEADSISSATAGNSGMGALRNVIEQYQDDTRFILTCNYLNKIIQPIQSRCIPINLKFNIKDVAHRLIEILKSEGIKFGKEVFGEFTEQVVKKSFPDIRTIVGTLELWCNTGEMTNVGISETNDTDAIVSEIIGMLKTKAPIDIRKYYIENEQKFSGDYEVLTGKIFDHTLEMAKVDPKIQITIAEFLYRMSMALDKEIQFYAMLLQLKGNL
ncbi:MAG TPA: AAA family ATPase [Saccharofermentans sp.]|nr:AAA family ATPase [Saccharofermentans sp.]